MLDPSRQSLTSPVVDALVATGIEAQRAGDPDAAEKAFREVLAADPTEPRAVRYLGAILAERGAIDAALECFEAALERVGSPSAATLGFYNNYANALRRAEQYSAAEKVLVELVSIARSAWQPWHNLGQTLREVDRLDEAEAAMRHAVTLEPGFGPNHGVLGEILFRLGQLEDAEAALQHCVDLGWQADPSTWATIGASRRLLGRPDEAREALERAFQLSGPTPTAHSNLGLVLNDLGRFDEAIAQVDAAVDIDPDDDTMHTHRGFVLLSAGRVSDGWEEWEHGLLEGFRGKERGLEVPRWTPDDADARVLVYREQGIGDELMFSSCYPDVIAAAREVVIECDPRLSALFGRSFPEAEVRAVSVDALGNETRHDFDRAIPAGSLPRFFRSTIDEFPDRRVILRAQADRVAEWHERLRAAGPPPYVGFAWRSGVITAERRREYTRLETWGEIFAVPNVTWVSLQYDECEPELRDAERRFGVRMHRWPFLDLMNDLDEVAALTSTLDLVVSARSAVAMLSGGLGVDTITLANRYAWADLGTARLPWLPAVRMMYRQPVGDWTPVLSATARAIDELANRTPSPD